MILKFVNRDEELRELESAKHALIYGRRRVGKTRLIKEFIKDKRAFYFLCQKNKIEAEFERFKERFSKTFRTYIEAKNFEEFFEDVKDQDIIFVFDEFSYWVEKNPGVPSLFQYIIDEILAESDVRLIFCGSLIGTMESLLSYRQPLYGRVKLRMNVGSLKFRHVSEFLPKYSVEDRIRVYMCVGGVPAYLQEFDDGITLQENLERLFFNKFGYLYDEAERLLKDELREPEIYLRILESIALGETKMGKIASRSFVDVTNLPKYLKILERMDIITREKPIVGRNRGIIKIKDNYFNFWIRFVYRYREEIELEVYDFSDEKFNSYAGRVFEDVCREFVADLVKEGRLDFTKIGRWWHKDREIDILALNERGREILFGECKWQEGVDAERVCREIARKSEYVEWFNGERKESFAVFARSFSEKIDEYDGRRVYCFDLKDMDGFYGECG